MARLALKQHRLSQRFVSVARQVRAAFDALGGAGKIVVLAADGSFCNRTVLTQPVAGVELIVRARKDAQLSFAAPAGSRRFYSPAKFTPEQVRQDPGRDWQTARVFYGGERRQIRYKEVRAVLWQGGARRRFLRLLVLAPTPYRKRNSGRLYYRQPAYLLTTVLRHHTEELLQIYFDRWQIEVNHREEKDTLGVGQAQLWNPISVPKQPVLVVAAYSALLLASLQAFGAERGQAYAPLPKWRRNAHRPSCLDLVTLLRKEMAEQPELVTAWGLNPTYKTLASGAAA